MYGAYSMIDVKTHPVEEWQKFDQKIIDWAITDQAVASTSEVMHSTRRRTL